MRNKFQHVALFGKYPVGSASVGLASDRDMLEGVAQFVQSLGCTVSLDDSTAAHYGITRFSTLSVEQIGQQCDVGLVVGGDGTMLGVGRKLVHYSLPLIGINQGRLGFVTDVALSDYQPVLATVLGGDYTEDARTLMRGELVRDGRVIFSALAMNDVVVNRGSTSGMVELRVVVGGHFVANHRADGLILATPTGSTAYALSVGGPLLHPAVTGWVLAPIAPHNLANRPIVVPDWLDVEIEVADGRSEASANFDMQSVASLQAGDRICVRRADACVRFLHPPGWTYFDTLRRKLHWNAGGA